MIADVTDRTPIERDLRLCMLEDLVGKCALLPDDMRSHPLAVATQALTAKPVRQVVRPLLTRAPRAWERDHRDVAIVTVKGEELDAALRAFGIPPEQHEQQSHIAGTSYWEAQLTPDGYADPISVVIMMVGEARNSPCAIACTRLFQDFRVDLCVLCGIAAGHKDKVDLGDLVIADLIFDYEGASIYADGLKRRPNPFSLEPPLPWHLERFETSRTALETWQRLFSECYAGLAPDKRPPAYPDEPRVPVLHRGVLVSGEKWIRQPEWLPDIANEYHEKIIAAEMEGSGFAQACRAQRIPWLDLRGISDHGTVSPGKEWHAAAALASATAAVAFLRTRYRPGVLATP